MQSYGTQKPVSDKKEITNYEIQTRGPTGQV